MQCALTIVQLYEMITENLALYCCAGPGVQAFLRICCGGGNSGQDKCFDCTCTRVLLEGLERRCTMRLGSRKASADPLRISSSVPRDERPVRTACWPAYGCAL